MAPYKRLAVLLAVLLAVTAPVAAASSAPTVRLEPGLDAEENIQTYNSEGAVTVSATEVLANITISKSANGVGLDGVRPGDPTTTYLRIDYKENITRTLRFEVPSAYFAPRVQRDAAVVDGSASASLQPASGGNSTMVSVTVDGATSVVIAIDEIAGTVWSARRWVRQLIANATGFELPSLTGDQPWTYIDSSEYGPNRSVTLNSDPDNLTMQYESPTAGGSTEWLSVPQCSDPEEQRVCWYRSGNQTVIMTAQDDPPRLRYKHGTDVFATVESWVNDLTRIPSRIDNWVSNLFG